MASFIFSLCENRDTAKYSKTMLRLRPKLLSYLLTGGCFLKYTPIDYSFLPLLIRIKPNECDVLPADLQLCIELKNIPRPGIRIVLLDDDDSKSLRTYSLSKEGTVYDPVYSGTSSCMSTYRDLENCPSLSSSRKHDTTYVGSVFTPFKCVDIFKELC